MGDGTSVAKEASDITIVDNSFSSIGRAVMWGRSLYQNIQRFVLFQLTVNIVACLIVLTGAFMGTESPLTVTQMLWVNLIMDTFAAMALASLPPSKSVMNVAPRDRNAFIISRPMWKSIIGIGSLFFFILFGLFYLFEHTDITSLTDIFHSDFTEAGEALQAEAYRRAWAIVQEIPEIDAFIYHAHRDNIEEGGLNLGLWRRRPDSGEPDAPKPIYEIFRTIDQ